MAGPLAEGREADAPNRSAIWMNTARSSLADGKVDADVHGNRVFCRDFFAFGKEVSSGI
jgi:hypothetical protein